MQDGFFSSNTGEAAAISANDPTEGVDLCFASHGLAHSTREKLTKPDGAEVHSTARADAAITVTR